MDPFSITLGAFQIAGECAKCTATIIKWVIDVRSADVRIREFYDEVVAFRETYESLERSLKSPLMLEAARRASKTPDGSYLWSQVQTALDDSQKTIQRVNSVLDHISKTTKLAKRMQMHLREQLKEGELSRLRDRVKMFNATISLPIQWICVTLQLEQRGISTDHQKQLDQKFVSLEKMMHELIIKLDQPSRVSTLSGSTLIVGATDDSVNPYGKENYLTFARKILQSASAAASTRSSLSTVSPQIEPPPLIELGGSEPPAYNQVADRRRTIAGWIPAPDADGYIDGRPRMASDTPQPKGKSYEINYKLAQKHLELGQQRAQEGNHESAEKSLRKTLQLLEKHDFSGRIAFQPAEVVLMLAQSCLMQKKYEEAVVLLDPVANREANIFPRIDQEPSSAVLPCPVPDKLQALAASHMLGQIYMQKGDFDDAKEHSLKAFTERMDELGESDEKTLESVQLVIEVYRAMGDEEEAEAYEVFLTPDPPKKEESHTTARAVPSIDQETAVPSISPPISEIAVPQTNPQPPGVPPARRSIAQRIREIGRPSLTSIPHIPSQSDTNQRLSFSRTTTANESPNVARASSYNWQSPSERSYDPSSTYLEDIDSTTAPSSTVHIQRSSSAKQIEPTFAAIDQLCTEGKHDKAVKIALSFIQGYPSSHFILRKDELTNNIRRGINGSGLAATGKGYSPLHFFCDLKEEHVDEIGLILKYGADVNAVAYKAGYTSSTSAPRDVLTPLQLSIERSHHNIVKMLLDHPEIRTEQKDGNKDGFAPLLAAMRKKQYATVRKLLEEHVPQCLPTTYPGTWYGNSVLHDAARHCDLTMLDILLEQQTQPMPGENGIVVGDNGVVSIGMLKPLFDVNLQDKFGKTALMHAIIKRDVSSPEEKRKLCRERVAVVKRLLEYGADVNLVDVKGLTARAYADREMVGDGGLEGQDEFEEEVRELRACVGEARFELDG